MIDKVETKKPSISELVAMHRRIAELEASETQHKRVDKVLRQAQAELTKQVRERTMELAKIKEKLRIEIDEHKELEELADILAAVGRRNIVAVRTSTDAISVASPVDGKLLFCNDAFLKRWKIKDDYHNLHYSDCFDVDPGSDVLMKASQTTMAGGWSGELTGKAMDGQTFPIQVNTAPVVNKEGSVVGLLGIFKDLTESKQAEVVLRESEERYRALVSLKGEVGEAVIMLQDTEQGDAIQTFVSDQWPRMTGYSRKELLGMPFFDLVLPQHRWASLERHRRKMKGESIPGLFKMSIIRKDGTEVPIELTSAYTTYQGERANVAYIRDITERKRYEEVQRESEEMEKKLQQSEFLNNVLDSLGHPLYVIDANDYTIKMANPAAKLGKLSENSTCYALTHKRDKPCWGVEHVCPLQEVKKTRKPVVVEHIHYDEDGNARNFEVHGYPIFDSEGNVIQMIECNFDITERKQAEDSLKESEAKLSSILSTMPDLVFVFDKEGRFTSNHFGSEELCGPLEKFIGKKHSEVMPAHVNKLFTKAFSKNKQGKVAQYKYHLEIGGETKWYCAKLFPIYLDGEFTGSVAVVREITKCKWVEQALAQE